MGIMIVFVFEQILAILGISSQAQLQSILDKLDKDVQMIYNQAEGSGIPEELNLPAETKICFVNISDSPHFYTDPKKTWNPDPVYLNIIKENSYNVWYEYNGKRNGHKIDNMAVRKSFCVTGSSKIYMENNGVSVGITWA
ncbi:MAG: hypothetical protein DRP27_10085 [Thermotogae bacterium]|nr:MAG: hypothetical protein DRP27_10085 [Thermotogota bacterium]